MNYELFIIRGKKRHFESLLVSSYCLFYFFISYFDGRQKHLEIERVQLLGTGHRVITLSQVAVRWT